MSKAPTDCLTNLTELRQGNFYRSISAIPITINGMRYRSKLEAKWALFFARLGWETHYEPYELNGWIPDFILKGATADILCEVKPFTRAFEFQNSGTIKKIVAAVEKSSKNKTEVLLLGVAPNFGGNLAIPGWLLDQRRFPNNPQDSTYFDFPVGALLTVPFKEYCGMGLTTILPPYLDRLTGDNYQSEPETWLSEEILGNLKQGWNECCSEVQWVPHADPL